MPPISVPAPPPQPDRPQYGLYDIALFKRYDRSSYIAAFGAQAPPFDPRRRPKDWFDSTAAASDPAAVIAYQTLAQDSQGSPAMRRFAVPASEAASVNLTGAYVYPPYNPLPTDAWQSGVGGARVLINPKTICAREDALMLASQLGATGIEEITLGGGFATIYPADEPRRQFELVFSSGLRLDAASLLSSMFSNGVGAPGHWGKGAMEPFWIPDSSVSAPSNPALLTGWETPVRDLLPNEKLVTSLFSGVVVERTDKSQSPGGFNYGYTDNDRQRDIDTNTLLHQIAKLMGG